MDPLKLGSRGAAVSELQLQLRALGYDVGDIDGIFGKKTLAAVSDFQNDVEALEGTGIVDAETGAALRQALVMKSGDPLHQAAEVADVPAVVPCEEGTWHDVMELVERVTTTPVRYGPGRGLFRDGNWVITFGPGGLGIKKWVSAMGHAHPSFHCSSWTNFFLGWLLRYDDRFTHAGNIPSLFELCEKSDEIHTQTGGSPYRGYGPSCREILTDGSTRPRKGVAKVIDIEELHARRESLPTFMVCGQSTRRATGWRWWHHTVLFVVDHRSAGAPMFRLAADGSRSSDGTWSGKAMAWTVVNDKWIAANSDNVIYRVYGVLSEDGTYGGTVGPRPALTIEV